MKPKQFFFAMLILLAALAGGGGYGYYTQTLALEKRTDQLRQKLADLQIADGEITKLNTLKTQYLSIEQLLPRLDIALPRAKQQSEIILQLERLAQNAGLNLPQTTFQAVTGLPGPTTQTAKSGDVFALPISFQMTGSYAQMQAFLQSLESFGRYTSVKSIAITSSAPRVLNFSVNLEVYMKP